MTNDELTPEEREALANLPRERMPSAGLEGRVVAAMREKGHLSRKPAKVIRLTTSRVAGLLAACLVLMIGAYSIGLRHGEVNDAVLTKVTPQSSKVISDEADREEIGGVRPPSTLGAVEKQRVVVPPSEPEAQFVDKDAPPFEPKLNVPQLAKSKDAKKEQARSKSDAVTRDMAQTFSDQIAAGSATPAPPVAEQKAAARQSIQSEAMMNSAESVEAWRTFALAGGTLMVEAPDSLRIVTDEPGRTLLIYTSDGIIRVRLAD